MSNSNGTSKLRVVALISGGKDSCFSMVKCVEAGHEIVALANLYPKDRSKNELDSYMYQTVGHQAIDLYAEAMDLPLFRGEIKGHPKNLDSDYKPTEEDEVEDLYELLKSIKEKVDFDAVCSGAIHSNYQKVRVEDVCARLNVQGLAYLWKRDQVELLDEMIENKIDAILIKVAVIGLGKEHLGKTLAEMRAHLHDLKEKYGINVCGEGGEFETFTLDCPLFKKKKLALEETEVKMHSDDAFAPVAHLILKSVKLVQK